MANIDLTWDAAQMAAATDIDSVEIWRIDGDQTANYPMTAGQTSASDAGTFVGNAVLVAQNLTKTDTSYTHSNVTNPGNGITWGVFSKNSAGYGPGSVFFLNF